jgi:GR25 family glycosyltransferase involved in LPS biosynthesis
MKAYAIIIKDNVISENGANKLFKSSFEVNNEFKISRFNAITPEKVDKTLKKYKLTWNYPWESVVFDDITKLKKSPYSAKDPNKKIACALSHYSLWIKCVELNEPILILEHDALFIEKLNIDFLVDSTYQIIGINNPLGSTRKSVLYNSLIRSNIEEIQPIPVIDDDEIPQGLAGASAYFVKPDGCKEVIEKIKEVGLWHNDALLCRQLFNFIGVTKKYYTKTQKLPSTTCD